MQIILLVLLGMLSAYREVQILIDRGSWRKEDYRNIFWYTDWKSWLKNFDSFHVINGLFVLVMMYALNSPLDSIFGLTGSFAWMNPFLNVIIYWLGFFKVRNIGLHIIFKKKPIYSYLLFWKMK